MSCNWNLPLTPPELLQGGFDVMQNDMQEPIHFSKNRLVQLICGNTQKYANHETSGL